MSTTLKVAERPGNTLTGVIRQAWDSGSLRLMTKSSPAKLSLSSASCLTINCRQLRPSHKPRLPPKQSPQKSLPCLCPRPSLQGRCPRRHVHRSSLPLPRPPRNEATDGPNNPRPFRLVQPRMRRDQSHRPRSQSHRYLGLVRRAGRLRSASEIGPLPDSPRDGRFKKGWASNWM